MNRRATTIVALAFFAVQAHAEAQDAPGSRPQPQAETLPSTDTTKAAPSGETGSPPQSPPQPEPKSPFSVQLNLDITNAYYYHGILQEKDGVIVQPAARFTMRLFEQDDFRIDALLATWNSFQGEKTNSPRTDDFIGYWYECDLIGGFVLTKDKLSLTTTYTFLTSPSDAYQTVQELDFTFAFDDSDLLGAFALHPYVLLGIETGANGSDGADTNPGTYLELGIAPGFSFDLGSTPISVSVPLSVGLSLDDYYENAAGQSDTFGFVQVGAKASFPLPISDQFGRWTVNVGVAGIFLGDNTAGYNGGSHEQVIGTLGLQLNF